MLLKSATMLIAGLQVKVFFQDLNFNMLIFKYIFYRIYNFYNKRWPNHDPEIYASYLLLGVVGNTIGITSGLLFYFLQLPFFELKKYFFVLLIPSVIIHYLVFLKNDRYKKYLNKKDYSTKWFQGWRGDVVFYFFFISQAFLILMAFVLRRNF